MKKNNISLNIICNMILQFVTLICGLIVPKLILNTFGSEINGLISSLNQFLNYIALLEGGVSSVMMASLYKPLYKKDAQNLSSAIKTITHFFKKIAKIFIVYCLLVAIIFPFFIKSEYNWVFISSLTLVLGVNMFVQYNFSLSYKILLNADNKVYITSLTQIICIILNTILTVILCHLFPSIHIIKLISAVCYLIQPIYFHYIINRDYNLDGKAPMDSNIIAQRWSGFGINIAAFIHNNTDIVILTLFTNLKMVSVYSVYLLVINGIKSIIMSISSAVVPSMGRIIAKENIDELNSFFDIYEFLMNLIVFILFTITAVMIVPFVLLYTNGIIDVNYLQPKFALIIVLAELAYCIRDPYVSVAYHSGHFKQLTNIAFVEAILNIIVSIFCVIKFGFVGVAIGTLISIFIRTIYQVYYLKNKILYRKVNIFVKYFIAFLIVFLFVYYLSNNILNLSNLNFLMWISNAIIVSGITLISYFFVSIIFFNKKVKMIINLIKERNKIK